MSPLPVSFKHVRRLTDDTGLLEHALGFIPRRKEGYSTDDQARALWACLEWLDYAEGAEADMLCELIDTYLSFLQWVQRDDGHFHNNIAYDRTPEDETPSDDCLGRCLWASALAMVKLRDRDRTMAAIDLFEKALPRIDGMRYPRGWAYALAAVALSIRHGDPWRLTPVLETLAGRLTDLYRRHAKADWLWYEPVLSYSNGVMPWGLLCAYEATKREEWLAVAKESLDFLIRLSVNEKMHVRPIGNRGWCTPGRRALWDQQPIDVMKLALAVSKAYGVTGDPKYADMARRCRGWYYGDNDAAVPMVDAEEGACCDGIGERGANRNKGAESTLSFLLTEVLWARMKGQ
ncbi:glycosyl transferase [Paenibacillus flagellatus]|uniref:Glycosyl transferase n=1 Tax=Paenibacillus flagellatus TaxID=2211139 RepID=A0A2V5K4S9_9BACL|nr:glycosyl transferase [Paenibacillus flagellatus]PYI54291.1 glycosyl transferase [Paenibacillus flagellatus]